MSICKRGMSMLKALKKIKLNKDKNNLKFCTYYFCLYSTKFSFELNFVLFRFFPLRKINNPQKVDKKLTNAKKFD